MVKIFRHKIKTHHHQDCSLSLFDAESSQKNAPLLFFKLPLQPKIHKYQQAI